MYGIYGIYGGFGVYGTAWRHNGGTIPSAAPAMSRFVNYSHLLYA